jgi:predicted transcriptional regulator
MILTDEQLEEKLKSPSNLLNQVKNVEIQKLNIRRREPGEKNIPPLVRSLIAGIAHISDESQEEIAETFDVSQHTVSAASRGLVGDRKDEGLTQVINSVKGRLETAHDFAVDALVGSLSQLSSRLSEIEKPEKLAAVAERMSKVVDNLSGNNREENERTVKVILMAPIQRVERDYEVIEIQS